MRKRALTLVEVMVTLSIIVLLAVIVISSLLSQKIIGNERKAQEGLLIISGAYEAYSTQHKGNYSVTLKDLSNQGIYNPPYLKVDYSAGANNGYTFSCTENNAGYVCIAKPAKLKETGTKTFSVCTGGVLREAVGETAPACP